MKKLITIHLLFLSIVLSAQTNFTDRSYFYGRDYFILRSGRAKMIIQADKADVGPAFSYLLFDSQETSQTSSKGKAFNYVPDKGFSSSALEVSMKKFPFTALGHNTTTRWVVENGIPGVEAIWWASGIKVREVITPVSLNGVFRRSITLESANLAGEDTVSVRLKLFAPATYAKNNVLIYENKNVSVSLSVAGNYPLKISSLKESFEIGPISIKPGEKKAIDSYLTLTIPSADQQNIYSKVSSFDKWIQDDKKATIEKWRNSNTILTHDKTVQDMFDHSRYLLPAYVADNGRMDAGIFEYGNQWVRDGSNTALGLIHVGEFELARAMLDHMLKNMILDNGTTMIAGGFDNPDREQFDQMGEFMHVMKSYLDWTGDTALLTTNSAKIVTMIERPLNANFRDSTGMVHNRREFWERTYDDAYELAYQTWVVQGLRDAADLSKYVGAEQKAGYWRKEADKIQRAMTEHPQMKLVDHGHLIKRRNITGEVVDLAGFTANAPDAPSQVEKYSRLLPDASMALPIAMNIVDPKSDLSKNTILELEKLWNQRWSSGGYDRYNTSSQSDQPGPWTFATTFIMRAQHEAGLLDMSRRSFEWLNDNAGGRTGAWFEEIPVTRTQATWSGLLPWTSAEVSYFIVHHMLGIKFSGDKMIIKPVLFPSNGPIKADLRFRKGRIEVDIDGKGPISYALINGIRVNPEKDGSISVPRNFSAGTIRIFSGNPHP